jgi:hypothetical protein
MQEAVWYRNKEIQSGRTEMLDAGIPMPSYCMLNCHVHDFKIESFHLRSKSSRNCCLLYIGDGPTQYATPPLPPHEKTCFWRNTYTAMDPATAAAQVTAATAASVQVDPIHSSEPTAATSHSLRLSLFSFWREDTEGWFHYAKFVAANLQLNSYRCYSQFLCALSPEVIAMVRDYVHHFQIPTRLICLRLTQAHSCDSLFTNPDR